MEKINIAELLRDCPKGMELYSPLCGKCVFDSLNMGTIICKKQNTQDITFTSEGYYMLPVFVDCECMIFPSKDQRDWSKFQRPFKDGDILTNDRGSICIYKGPTYYNKKLADYYCGYRAGDHAFVFKKFKDNHFGDIDEFRLATEEEEQQLFDAIKANGFKWNKETKTLEKLVEPKFKVGDRIRRKNSNEEYTIISISAYTYYYRLDEHCTGSLGIQLQDDYELVPNKFDITTLKPFDKVLVRSGNYQTWTVGLFGFYSKENNYPFACVGGYVYQCIPYEENKHLLGTTDDCDEFYKTWE